MGREDGVIELAPYRLPVPPYTRRMFWDGAVDNVTPAYRTGWDDFTPVRATALARRHWIGPALGIGSPGVRTGWTSAERRFLGQYRPNHPLCKVVPVFYSPQGTEAISARMKLDLGPNPMPIMASNPAFPRPPYVRTALGGIDGLVFGECQPCADPSLILPGYIPDRWCDFDIQLSSGGSVAGRARMTGSCVPAGCSDGLEYDFTSKYSEDCCPTGCYHEPEPGRHKYNSFIIVYDGGTWVGSTYMVCLYFEISPVQETDPTCTNPSAVLYGGGILGGFTIKRCVGNCLTPEELTAIKPGEAPWCDCQTIFEGRWDEETQQFLDGPVGCEWAAGYGWGNWFGGDACEVETIAFSSASGWGQNQNPDWCWNYDPRDGGGAFHNAAICPDGDLYPDYRATYSLTKIEPGL